MAIFRNVAISLLGHSGHDNPIEALIPFAWNSADAVKLVIGCPRLSDWTKMK
jgi:hypothetical protein